jgi:hypothetical protein
MGIGLSVVEMLLGKENMKRREFLKRSLMGLGLMVVPGPILSLVPINFYYRSVQLNKNWLKRIEIGSVDGVRFIESEIKDDD